MKLNDLISLDPSLKDHSIKKWDEEIKGPTTFNSLRPGHFVFVKDFKFFKKLLEVLNQKENESQSIGLIFDQKFLEKIEKDEEKKQSLSEVTATVGFVLTSSAFELTLGIVSKIFYDQKIGRFNDMVDGRQMGTAKVHPTAWIAQGAFIGEDVEIGEKVKIYSGAVVMSGSKIGDGTEIFPNVTIYHLVKIGKNCRIHSGSVIGADGFSYNFVKNKHVKVWHIGGVDVGDEVEIGANTSIDAGTFAPTIIGSGAKIDNLVQIGHNSNFGQGVIVCGQAGSAGSCTLGDFSVVGGKAALTDNIIIGKGCQIAGMSGVTNSWNDGSVIAGHPARPLKEWLKGVAFVRKQTLNKG